MFYSKGADCVWYEMISATQCPHVVSCLSDEIRCQAIAGHDGNCWAFSPIGAYLEQSRLKSIDDSGEDGYSSHVPPGHERYPDVIEKYKASAAKQSKMVPITDESLIAELESSE